MIAAHYTLLLVLTGTTILGFTCGIIGAFTLLRKQSLLGDTLSHACLPGIALAFLYAQSTHPLILLTGGIGSGLIAATCIQLLNRYTTLKTDAILGTVLSVFFGMGLVFMTHAQKFHDTQHAALNTIIFGNAATIFVYDIVVASTVAILVLALVALLWKELKLLTFDYSYAQLRHHATPYLDNLMILLIVTTIAVGLHMVGVVLMSTMLVAPAATARLWTHRFDHFIVASGIFGIFFSSLGTYISSCYHHMPTGPVIAVIAISSVLFSLFLTTYSTTTRSIRS